jgi:hypothetical protein
MNTSLVLRFFARFFGDFMKTVRDDKMSYAAIPAMLLWFLLNAKAIRLDFWTVFGPLVFGASFVVGHHAWTAARSVIRDIQKESVEERRSEVLDYFGKQAITAVYKEHPPLYEIRLYGIFAMVLAICGVACILSVNQYRASVKRDEKPHQEELPLAATEVYLDCHPTALPLRIEPHSTAHMKIFNEKEYGNTKSSMYDVNNDGDKELLWPDESVIKRVPHNPGVFGWQCALSNHAQSNLMDVAVKLIANYDSEKASLDYFVVASPLDAGNTFHFLVLNGCPAMVSAVIQDQVGVQVVGESERRTVPLHFPNRTPIQQIMILLGSKVSWNGDPCS